MPGQRGVGLIEVMIGLTAGLVLIGALAYFFLGARQLNRTSEDVSRMQESGRIAIDVMSKAIRQAGARSVPPPGTLVEYPGGALAATEGASGAPDTIVVRYDVQDGGEADCLGNNVASGTVTYVFAVDPVNRTLTCTNATGVGAPTPVVVMDNIENMQITYGVDSNIVGNSAGAIEAYQSAAGLVPFQVAAVRVSLLVRGPTESSATGSQTYAYDGASTTVTDRFLRQIYAATITVRNQVRIPQ